MPLNLRLAQAKERLRRAISQCVTSQDGPQQILDAIDALVDIKIEMAVTTKPTPSTGESS